MTGFAKIPKESDSVCAMYNPKEYRYFVSCESKTKIDSADLVRVSNSDGIEVWNPILDEDTKTKATEYL